VFELRTELWNEYAEAIGKLGLAGVNMIDHPELPQWFHAQRVVVAAVRAKLVGIDPEIRPEELRAHEARMLFHVRDIASRTAGQLHSKIRRLATDDTARKKGLRRRTQLDALACEWEAEGHSLLWGQAN
jgi:hypothetical protein